MQESSLSSRCENNTGHACSSITVSGASTDDVPGSKIRVAIVGAGAAGLIMARHVVSRLDTYAVDVLEQMQEIGGTWVYTDETETGRNGLPVHSSMYKNLRTNLPKEVMQIPDFHFEEIEGLSFVHHTKIRQYLLDYAEHFHLYPHIKLNTLVEYVEPQKLAKNQVVWTVRYRNLATNIQTVKTYDAVVLCNGHYTVGYMPDIPGIDSFKGISLHSHQYRSPEVYAGKNVCILGASQSGLDISFEVSKYAKRVYLSHNLLESINLQESENIEQRSGIVDVNENTFMFRGGSSAQIDVLIYCTGYQYTYPFVSSKVKIRTENNHVEPIYKYLIHMDWPNLFFMGLLVNTVPFPMFHIQAQYILAIIEGGVKLPSPKQMREEFDKEKKSLLDEGINIRHINKMGERQWSYQEEIAKIAGVPGCAPVIKKMYEYSRKMQKQNFTTYKNYQFKIVDQENFIVFR